MRARSEPTRNADDAAQQSLFKPSRAGGRRKGAGRKPKGRRAGTTHEARPTIRHSHALHVVLRAVPEVGSLRRRAIYHAIREATIVVGIRERIRIVHLSIQRTHLHLLVEAEDSRALARGMQDLTPNATKGPLTRKSTGHRSWARGLIT